jgi:hypothetical protein
MAFQFPANPLVGDVYAPIPGVNYKWNGTGWAPFAMGYITGAEADARYLQLTGGTLTGNLTMSGASTFVITPHINFHDGTALRAHMFGYTDDWLYVDAVAGHAFRRMSDSKSWLMISNNAITINEPINVNIQSASTATSTGLVLAHNGANPTLLFYRIDAGAMGIDCTGSYIRMGSSSGTGIAPQFYFDNGGNFTINGQYSRTSGSATGLGSIDVAGSAGGYAGIWFPGASQSHLLMQNYAGTSGFHQQGVAWMLQVTNGSLTVPGNVTAYSDERLKTNMEPFALSLGEICRLQPMRYDRIDHDYKQVGVTAQSLQDVLPECVDEFDVGLEGKDKKLAVDYGRAALVIALMLAREIRDRTLH